MIMNAIEFFTWGGQYHWTVNQEVILCQLETILLMECVWEGSYEYQHPRLG